MYDGQIQGHRFFILSLVEYTCQLDINYGQTEREQHKYLEGNICLDIYYHGDVQL